jgi:hypothetical protein
MQVYYNKEKLLDQKAFVWFHFITKAIKHHVFNILESRKGPKLSHGYI